MTDAAAKPAHEGAIEVSALSHEDILARRDSYAKRVEKLRKALDHATGRLDALNGVIAEFNLESAGKQPEPAVPPGDVEAIRGKPIRQALIILAERHDSVLKSGDARRALEMAEVVEAPMPPNRLWKEIMLLRRFNKLHRGTYKLMAAEPETGTFWDDD